MDPPSNMRKRAQLSPPPAGHSAADAANPTPVQPSAPRRGRRLAHPAVQAITSAPAIRGPSFVGYDPYAATAASLRTPARGFRPRPPVVPAADSSSSESLLPTSVKDATPTLGTKARNSVMETPSLPLATLATPAQIWLLCAFTMEVDSTNNCLGDTVNGCLKCMRARYSHVELVFGFEDGTWQALKTNMARGTVLLDAETTHYRCHKVWKAFRFCITESQRTEFYARAVAYQGSPFNAAALTLYTPGCYSFMRYCCCLFNCCLGISYDTTSGRYYCTQIVLLVMQSIFPEQYGEVDATSVVPDTLVPLLLRTGHIVADFFQRTPGDANV